MLQSILNEVKPLIGQGKVADYIPALANVNNEQLGISVCTLEGEVFQAGDATTNFSIQSISKALNARGCQYLWSCVNSSSQC